MFETLKKLIRSPSTLSLPAVPAGQRVYAVGDIHGRRDLFDALIAAIEADDAARGRAETTIVLLGDLVDRGPDSAGVVAQTEGGPIRLIGAGTLSERLRATKPSYNWLEWSAGERLDVTVRSTG